MNLHNYIEKIRALPDKHKKIILWTIVAILAIAMGFFWIRGTMNNLQKLGENINQIKLPDIQMPTADILQTTTPSSK